MVGAIFKNTSQAKQFLLQEVLPKLHSGEYPWFAKDVFDISSYQSGVDRCIGSAKLMVDEPDQMRFLDTSPLEHVSDLILTAIFHRCPNEYLVTVLGWIYPHFKTTCPEPHRLIVQGFGACPGSTSNKRKRNDIITIDSVSNEEKERIQSMVTESLEAAGLAVGWTGSGAVHGWDKRDCEFVEIKASGTSYFCAHNECVELTPKTEWNQAVRKPNATPHTQNAGKIKFRRKKSSVGEAAAAVRWLWGVRVGGGSEPERFFTSKRKMAGRARYDRPFSRQLQDGSQRHSGSGLGRGLDALTLYLPGRATAAPAIHSRAGAFTVCVLAL